jgi:hypothetical protein
MTTKSKIEKEILKKLKNSRMIPSNFSEYILLDSPRASMLFYNEKNENVVYVHFSYGRVETDCYNYKDILKYVNFVETKNRYFKCFNFRRSAYPVLEYKLKSIGLSFSFHKRSNYNYDEYKAIKFHNDADEATFRLYYSEKICTPKEYRFKSGVY